MSALTADFLILVRDLNTSPLLAVKELMERYSVWGESPRSPDDADTNEQFFTFVEKFSARHDFPIEFVGENVPDRNSVNLKRLELMIKKIKDDEVGSEIDDLIDRHLNVGSIDSFGYAFLNESEKKRLHENINRIREIISSSDLTDRKRNLLFDRLNKLAAEVDQVGTATDRFFVFLSDAAFVVGDMAKKAKPFTDEVKDMIKTIGKARARQEGVSLPEGDEPLRLPAPEAQE